MALPNPVETSTAAPGRASSSPAMRLLRRLMRAKLALAGSIILLLVSLTAVFAPIIVPADPSEVNIMDRLKPPVWQEGGDPRHLLGTDQVGRDILSRLIYGSRVSLLVGLAAVALGGTVGVILGLTSGYFGGVYDDVVVRVGEIQQAFPFILLAIAFLVVLGQGLGNLILVLGISGWVPYCRVVRASVLSIREREFVEAAHAMGARNSRIIYSHILPNVTAPVIVIASFSVASTIIAEASLSFLGLGVPVSVPTWGAMLSEGREYLREAWWLVTFPGLAIMMTVLGINVLGDWLRDMLDPRLKNTDIGR